MRLDQHVILIDWGSTNFRAYLISGDGQFLDVRSSRQGVKDLQRAEIPAILGAAIASWKPRCSIEVALLAGMIGGDLGWRDVPLVACPAGASEIGSAIHDLGRIEDVPVGIVPGVFSKPLDSLPGMMRGEETQILGSLSLVGVGSGLFCLPGTHTKWAEVKRGKIIRIVTSMTGEVFEFLLSRSVLANCLNASDDAIEPIAFMEGIAIAAKGVGALQLVFNARVQKVLGILDDPKALRSQTSGILIGSEVKAMIADHPPAEPIFVVSSARLGDLYRRAMEHFGVAAQFIDEQDAFVKGGMDLLAMTVDAVPSWAA